MGLEVTLEGTGAEIRIEATVDDGIQGGVGELHLQLAGFETAVQVIDHQADDGADILAGEGLVIHDFINPVEEFGTEVGLQQTVHGFPGFRPDFPVFDAVEDILAAQVAGHDEDGVLEIHGAALAVGDAAVVENLEQDVEHIRMGLFHFIKEDDTIGMAADGFGELASLVVADVSGRCPDQTGDAEFFHVFGHIDPDHVLFIVEERLGQGLGQLGLADAGGAEEEEGSEGPVGVLDPRTGAEDGFGHLADGFILADDTAVQLVLEMEELFALAFHKLGHGDTGPAADDPGDFLFGDLIPQEAVFAAAFLGNGFFLFQLLLQLRQLAVLQLGGAVQIVGALRLLDFGVDALDFLPEAGDLADGFLFGFPTGFHGVEGIPLLGQFLLDFIEMDLGEGVFFLLQGGLLDFQLHDVAADIVQLGGEGIDLRADEGAGFVHQVDGLVGQETVGDIPVGKGCGGDEGGILDLDAVEDFIALLQAAEDGDRILDGGLGNHDRLEPALEGGILFDILPIFIQGGGADAVQLAAGQHGLEQIACVHGAVGLAGTDDGMQFIDEEEDPALALADFLEDGLEALLEFAAELGAGDEAAHIEGEDGFILQAFRHVAADDPQGQALGDGGFADAGLADEDRVVLGFAGKNADDIPDFGIAADDRIQLLLPGQFDQIGTVFLQGIIGILGAVGGDTGGTAHFLQGLEEGFRRITEGFQELSHRGGRLGAQAHPQMLHGQVFVLHLLRDFFRLEEGLFNIGGVAGLGSAGAGDTGHPVQPVLQGAAERIHRNAAAGQELGDQILRVFSKRREKMLLLHIHVAVFHSKRLRPLEGGQGLLRKLIHIHHSISSVKVIFDFL